MGTQPEASPRIAFGPYEFDLASADLRKFGTRIRLQGKPVQILSILLAESGNIVSREHLQSCLWPDTAFGDFEQGLNAAVSKLRQALGDSADQPRYIETLPGRGYRFIGPIQRGPAAKPVLELARPAAARPAASSWWLPAGAAVLLAAGAGYAARAIVEPSAPVPATVRFTVRPPAGFELEGGASRQAFALSPDGTKLAFTAMDASNVFHVFVRDLASIEAKKVQGSDGAHTVFWSPDSRSLFLTARGVLRRSAAGGPADAVLGDVPAFMMSGLARADGEILLGTRRASFRMPRVGGPFAEAAGVFGWPQQLPDGSRILYVDNGPSSGQFVARVARPENPASVRDILQTSSRVLYTASTASRGGYLLFVRGGSLMAQRFDLDSMTSSGDAVTVAANVYSFGATGAADFSVSDRGVLAYLAYTGRSQLTWVDRHGKRLASVGPADVNVKSARLSPDGNSVAAPVYDIEAGVQDIWLFNLRTGESRRLDATPGLRDSPVWSPDGKRLAYLRGGGGGWPRVSMRGLGQTDAETDPPSDSFQSPTSWTPDGRYVAFSNTGFPRVANDVQADVNLIDTVKGNRVVPLLRSPLHEANAEFSPDGRWLAFTSNESGKPQVYIQRFEGGDAPSLVGERILVSRSGALAVRWRGDGKELYYLDLDGRVQAVPLGPGDRPAVGEATALFTISTEARAAFHSLAGFDVSRDGKRFLIPVVSSAEGPSLVVVKDWEQSLPR